MCEIGQFSYLFIYLFNNLFKLGKFTKILYTYVNKKNSQTNWLIKVIYPILQKKKKRKEKKKKKKEKQVCDVS